MLQGGALPGENQVGHFMRSGASGGGQGCKCGKPASWPKPRRGQPLRQAWTGCGWLNVHGLCGKRPTKRLVMTNRDSTAGNGQACQFAHSDMTGRMREYKRDPSSGPGARECSASDSQFHDTVCSVLFPPAECEMPGTNRTCASYCRIPYGVDSNGRRPYEMKCKSRVVRGRSGHSGFGRDFC